MNPSSQHGQGHPAAAPQCPPARTTNPTEQGHTSQSQGSSGSGTAGAVLEKAQDLASNVADRAGEAWESTKRGAQQAGSAVADWAGDAWDDVSRFVSRYPVATVAIGGGLAWLLVRGLRGSSGLDFSGGRWRDYDRGRVPSGYRYEPWSRPESQGRERPSPGGTGTFGERSQETGPSVAERVGDAWESTRQGAQQMASNLANRAEEAWDSMRDIGRSYPLGTLAVGAALGFGLAQLLGCQGMFASFQKSSRPYSSEESSQSFSRRF